MELGEIFIDGVTVGHRHRNVVDEAKVILLAESMKEIGLQTPITVWTPDDKDFFLVAGLHRLRAAERLGWDEIPCFFVVMNEVERELWEIDENLYRSELTPAQVATQTARRKELWGAKKEQETGDQTLATSLPDGRAAGPQHQKGFAAETAEKTGQSKSAINLAISRGEKIAPDVLQAVQGTDMDTGVTLDRLAALPPEEQREAVAQRHVPPRAPSPAQVATADDRDVAAFSKIWDRTSPAARALIREIAEPDAAPSGVGELSPVVPVEPMPSPESTEALRARIAELEAKLAKMEEQHNGQPALAVLGVPCALRQYLKCRDHR